MARVRFELNLGEIKERVENLGDRLDTVINGVVQYTATEGVAYMKQNAPWTDRTTAARNGLHTIPDTTAEDQKSITFSHTVPYGIWLEIANSGRYQIIMPSVKHEGDLLMQRLEGILRKIDQR